jgi:hypothetical protein
MHIAFANTKVSSTKNNAGDVAIDSLLHDCIEFLPKVSPLRTGKIDKNYVENNKTRIMCAINKCEDRMCKQMNSEQKHSYIFFFFIEFLQKLFLAVGFSILIALTSLNERECVEISSILYEKSW